MTTEPNTEHEDRYTSEAEALLAAPNPTTAIAYRLAVTDGRVDALAQRVNLLEGSVAHHREVAT